MEKILYKGILKPNCEPYSYVGFWNLIEGLESDSDEFFLIEPTFSGSQRRYFIGDPQTIDDSVTLAQERFHSDEITAIYIKYDLYVWGFGDGARLTFEYWAPLNSSGQVIPLGIITAIGSVNEVARLERLIEEAIERNEHDPD
jgi:hypothetical protein